MDMISIISSFTLIYFDAMLRRLVPTTVCDCRQQTIKITEFCCYTLRSLRFCQYFFVELLTFWNVRSKRARLCIGHGMREEIWMAT
jgi:hypothetical protein